MLHVTLQKEIDKNIPRQGVNLFFSWLSRLSTVVEFVFDDARDDDT